MSDELSFGFENADYDTFITEFKKAKEHSDKIEEKIVEEDIDINKVKKARSNNELAVIRLDGIGITNDGTVTRSDFFESLELDTDRYGDLAFTKEEADIIKKEYKRRATGVNSVVPMRCFGEKCPFNEDCPYYSIDKVKVGLPCLVERDLLNYHTKKFIEEFDVDPKNHSEVMLIQELSELIIYEMRATMKLASENGSQLMGYKLKFSPDGEEIQEETFHWAWELKDKIKNRRMKILEALNATRRSKLQLEKDAKSETEAAAYSYVVKGLLERVDALTRKNNDIEEAKIIE